MNDIKLLQTAKNLLTGGKFFALYKRYNDEKSLIEQLQSQYESVTQEITALQEEKHSRKLDQEDLDAQIPELKQQLNFLSNQITTHEQIKTGLKIQLDKIMTSFGENPLDDYTFDPKTFIKDQVQKLVKKLAVSQAEKAIVAALAPLAPFILLIILFACVALMAFAAIGGTRSFSFEANCSGAQDPQTCRDQWDANSSNFVFNSNGTCGGRLNPCTN